MTGSFRMTRRAALAGAVGVALSAPMINRGTYAFAAAPAKIYSRRAVDLVASSLVIAMLAPLTITLSPDYIAHLLTHSDSAHFPPSRPTPFPQTPTLVVPDSTNPPHHQ